MDSCATTNDPKPQHHSQPLFAVNHVYIIATPEEPDRYEYMRKWLERMAFPDGYVEVVCPTYKTNLRDEHITKYVKDNNSGTLGGKKLTLGEISLAINHIECFRKACESPTTEVCLILESDAVMQDSFRSDMEQVMRELQAVAPEFDYVSIGNGCNLHAAASATKDNDRFTPRFYRVQSTRCTDSMVWRTSALRKAIQTNGGIVPFDLPIDFQLNEFIRKHNLNAYWLEPTIVTAGSCVGLYPTTVV